MRGRRGRAWEVTRARSGRGQNEHERLKVLQRMWAHAQYCMSGDCTLEATAAAIEEVAAIVRQSRGGAHPAAARVTRVPTGGV